MEGQVLGGKEGVGKGMAPTTRQMGQGAIQALMPKNMAKTQDTLLLPSAELVIVYNSLQLKTNLFRKNVPEVLTTLAVQLVRVGRWLERVW